MASHRCQLGNRLLASGRGPDLSVPQRSDRTAYTTLERHPLGQHGWCRLGAMIALR